MLENLTRLSMLLQSKGWVVKKVESEYFMVLYNSFLLIEPVEINIPTQTNAVDFPSQLLICLRNIVSLHPELADHFLVRQIFTQAKNIRHKFSKRKSEWILGEANSKYKSHEIPEIYIPKPYI